MPLTETGGFRQLLLSELALGTEDGKRIHLAFQRAGLPITFIGEQDELALSEVGKASLILRYAPSFGWISEAEHGIFQSRPGEHYLHPIVGCQSFCTYCYLIAHSCRRRPLQLFVGLDDLLRTLDVYIAQNLRKGPLLFCTGELADSLADSDLYPVSPLLVRYFAGLRTARLELRSKSDKVHGLLNLAHNLRTTVSFSISPASYVERWERGTASLDARLNAARLCQDSGYPVALKFEPVILSSGWEAVYQETMEEVQRIMIPSALDHVSVGCLRWSQSLADSPAFRGSFGALINGVEQIEYRPATFNYTHERDQRLAAYLWFRELLRASGITAPIWWSLEHPDLIKELA